MGEVIDIFSKKKAPKESVKEVVNFDFDEIIQKNKEAQEKANTARERENNKVKYDYRIK